MKNFVGMKFRGTGQKLQNRKNFCPRKFLPFLVYLKMLTRISEIFDVQAVSLVLDAEKDKDIQYIMYEVFLRSCL